MTSCLVIVFTGFESLAGFDFTTNATFRSYPLGGTLAAQLGYGFVLWGAAPSTASDRAKPKPWHGYIRPSLELATAGSFQQLKGELELFPISILGVRAGHAKFENKKDYSAFDDCTNIYLCEGAFTRDFVEAQLVLGTGPFFLVGLYRVEELATKEQNPTQDFIFPTAGLPAAKTGDTLVVVRGALGVKWSKNWITSAYYIRSEMDKLVGKSDMGTLNLHYNWSDYSILVGAGYFESDIIERGFTGTVRLSWSPLKSIGLF